MPFGRELVLRGAEERLAPILMTALTTALGLLPLVIAGNRPGHEIEYPMAVVIFGGLRQQHAPFAVVPARLVRGVWCRPSESMTIAAFTAPCRPGRAARAADGCRGRRR